MAGEAVGSGAEDHPAQRYGLSRLAGAEAVPDFLRYVGKPGTIIAVTGTNGKTTVSNLLTDILEADGKKVLSNRSGSNITSGISTALLRGCDLLGRAKPYDMAVLEWTSGPASASSPM